MDEAPNNLQLQKIALLKALLQETKQQHTLLQQGEDLAFVEKTQETQEQLLTQLTHLHQTLLQMPDQMPSALQKEQQELLKQIEYFNTLFHMGLQVLKGLTREELMQLRQAKQSLSSIHLSYFKEHTTSQHPCRIDCYSH